MNLRSAMLAVVFFVFLTLTFTLAFGQAKEMAAPDPASRITAETALDDASGGAVSENRGPRSDLRLLFTGYLLGYYRLPQWQTADFETECPEAGADNASWRKELGLELSQKPEDNTAAFQFLSLLTGDIVNPANEEKRPAWKPRGENDLFVGVGDNFGVTLESRAYRDQAHGDTSKPWDLHAKSRNLSGPLHPDKEDLQWTTARADQIGDNVGCFLSRAGYDAIVPGKNDFYFGAERLMRIAERLANVPAQEGVAEKDKMHKVRMLAANLIVKTDLLEKPDHPIDDSAKDLKFLPGMPDGVESLDVSDKGMLLPYMRQVRFKIAAKSKYSAKEGEKKDGALQPFLCEIEGAGTGLDQLDPTNPKLTVPTGCSRMELKERSPVADLQDTRKALPGKDGSTTMYFNLPDGLVEQSKALLPRLFGLCVGRVGDDVNPLAKKATPAPDEKPRDYYCLRFTIARPLFWESPKPGGNAESREKNNYPYVVKDTKNGHAVIFGVVDQDVVGHVGRDNLSWRNNLKQLKANAAQTGTAKAGDETYGTIVAGVSPTTALVAAMRHFELVVRPQIKKDGKPIYRVLLAQMDRGKAETLGAELAGTKFGCTDMHFDVIVSAAADASAATASEDLTLLAKHEEKDPEEKAAEAKPENDPCAPKTDPAPDAPSFRQFVVVPFRGYDDASHKLLNPLRELVLRDRSDRREFAVDFDRKWRKGTPARPTEFKTREDKKAKIEDNYNGMGSTYLSGKGYWPAELTTNKNGPKAPDSVKTKGNSIVLKNPFQIATLAILREFTKADVAMLQKHDFYFGPFPPPLNEGTDAIPNGEILERILWMGDYLQVLTVKGDTLKKVLDESDKFDALDAAAAIEGMETERGLLTFGLQKTRDEQYLVDGMQLDPNRLYTIATSNHIAAGDTGYPELADPAFADLQLPAPDKDHDADDHHPRISKLVCDRLHGSSCVTNPGLLFADANAADRPSQLEPDFDAKVRAYKRNFIGAPRRLYDGNSLVDYEAQLEPTWRFSVKDLTVNFSAVRNNLSTVDQATKLGGVQEPAAGNPKSHSADVETHVELVRNKPRWDEYLRGSFLFKVSATDQTEPVSITTGTTPGTETVPALRLFQFVKNQAATDAGFFWHRKHKYSNRIGLILEPFHWDAQIERQPLLVNTLYATDGTVTAPAIIKNLPRVYRFMGRIAVRAEGDKNYFELGYEGGREFNGLQSIGSCNPTATTTVTACLQGLQSMTGFSLSQLPIATQARERNGIYGNLDWTTPLFWKLSLHSQDALEYYGPAHLDNSTDTKYRNDATETLSWKVWPNLTIGPSLERFDYENKVTFVHLRTWTPGVSMTYSFDRYRGGSWIKSMRYGAGGGSQ